jgi:Nif-specific regulatory protein
MQNLYLETLFSISEVLSSSKSHTKTLKEVLNILSSQLGMQRGLISIFHKSLGELHSNIWLGEPRDDEELIKFKLGEGITGKVAEHGIPMAFSKLDDVPFFLNRSGFRKNMNLSELAFICVPIKYYNEVIGTLSVDQINIHREDKNSSLDNELKLLNVTALLIASYLEQIKIEKENKILRNVLLGQDSLKKIIGNSSKLKATMTLVAQVADSPTTVMITGETGTGKELIAEAIHSLSSRKDGPFIRINCGAIPETLIESELFGHEKGSFTGAFERKVGKLEVAHKGSIFLDEIGELPLLAQVKLLRALQEKEIERIGSTKPIKIDVRIIAATNRQLEKEVNDGKFRSDLYYRLNVFPIHTPPLRERGADIMLLSDFFVEKYTHKLNKKVNRISTAAIDALMAYHWPGNVRELENCIERAVLLATENVIRYQDLPPSLQMKEKGLDLENAENQKIDIFRIRVEAFEKELIIEALKNAEGNQAKAAQQLGSTIRVIQYKIQKLNIDYKKFRGKDIT